MTSKLTRERLEEIRDYDTCVTLEESAELARMALAAMDTEPVAYMLDCVGGTDYSNHPERGGVPLYRHAQPAQTGVDDDVRNIIGLLETNEWAEHCTETVLGSRLEAEITRLIGSAQPAPLVSEVSPLVSELTAPVVPDEWTIVDAVKFCRETERQDAGAAMDAWNACRAAMLQAGTLANEGTIQAGNSPVIPEGYVMVPKEPTDEMIAVAMNCDDVLFNSDESFCIQFGNIYEAMLAAALQEVK